jgi:hypothetical protein
MKNIHVIPTDKPSRLYLGNNGNFVFGMMQTSIQSKNDDFTNQNIYITNSEEIKKGDWFITTDTNEIHKSDWIKFDFDNGKKIILTTDDQLIKDGIQAIDDEFLEWFIKNQSYEEIKVEHNFIDFVMNDYKIIIPQEEPKQENCCTPIGQIKRYVDCVGCDREPKKVLTEEDIFNQRDIDAVTDYINKETLEENEFCHYSGLPSPTAYEDTKETLEEAVISKERLKRAFLNAKKHIEMQNNVPKYRATGFLEGILFALNQLEEGKDFVFKTIEYEEIGWFGGKTIKTRKQTYSEFIIEKFEKFLNK